MEGRMDFYKMTSDLYSDLTSEQMREIILEDDSQSKMALWYFLNIRMKRKMHACLDYLIDSEVEDARQYEDYIEDFYMYVYEYKPKNITGKEHYYILQNLNDCTKMESCLLVAFKRFLRNEMQELRKKRENEKDILFEINFQARNNGDIQQDMRHIGYTIAVLNQREDSVNRYILFRSLANKMLNNYAMLQRPTDEVVAEILGLSYGTYRTRASRLFAQLRLLRNTITIYDIDRLTPDSLSIINRLVNYEVDLDAILALLLKLTERRLPTEMQKKIVDCRVVPKKNKVGCPSANTEEPEEYLSTATSISWPDFEEERRKKAQRRKLQINLRKTRIKRLVEDFNRIFTL